MIRKLKLEILKSIKNKRINVFFLFLLFSFIILIFSKLSKEYTDTIVFGIEKTNLPEEYIILEDTMSISITLKTHGFKWFQYYMGDPKIKIDFSKDVDKEQKVFVWNKSKEFLMNTQFDEQVELLNIFPAALTFRYDSNMIKKVPVRLNTNIDFKPGYDISDALVTDPDTIVVIGPKILVSEISYLETHEAVLSDVKSDLEETITLKLPEEHASDLKFSATHVMLRADVEKFTEGTLKIPVRVINVPEGIKLKYFPKDVHVSYYTSLSNFNSVKENDFEVVCDFKRTQGDQSFLIPRLTKFPKTVKHIKINQQRIEFIITK